MKESIMDGVYAIGGLIACILFFGSVDYLLSLAPWLNSTQSKALIMLILSFCGLVYVIYLLDKNVLNYKEIFIQYKSSGEFMLHVVGITLFSMLVLRGVNELIPINISILYMSMQILFWFSILFMLYNLFFVDTSDRMPTNR